MAIPDDIRLYETVIIHTRLDFLDFAQDYRYLLFLNGLRVSN